MTDYRPWPRAPQYLVGSDGSITGPSGRELCLFCTGDDPYPLFCLWTGGRYRNIKVHIVVCETFHGPRPPGHEAAHENGVPSDCRADNLTWKTPIENAADKVHHGTTIDGERNGRHVLTIEQVREIRASGEVARVFAERFGVSLDAIRKVRSGRTWRRVQ